MNIHGIQSVGTLTQQSGGFATLTGSFTGSFKGDGSQLTGLPSSSADTGSLVTTASFNAYTSSTNGRLNNIESTTASLLVETQNLELFSASALVSISNINSTTASLNNSVSALNTSSASQQVSIDALNVFTASQSTASIVSSISQLNQATASIQSATASLFTSASLALVTASFDNGTRNLTFTKGDTQTFSVNIPDVSGSAGTFVTTSSFNAYTSSNDQKVNSLISATGSYATTGSNVFVGNQTITGSVIISSSATDDLTVYNFINVKNNDTGTEQLGLGSNQFNLNTTKSTTAANGFIIGPTGSSAQLTIGVYDDPGFAIDIENKIEATATGITFNDWDNGSTFAYVPYMTIAPNTGNNPKPVMTRGLEVTGSTEVGTFTASLQNGFTYVGNASGRTTTVATSSFGTPIPTGTISSSAQITALGFVSSSVTASSIVTASVNLNTITFTKGDASTFALTVNTGSGGGGGAAFPFTGDAVITGSLLVSGSTIPDVRVIGNIDLTGSMRVQPVTLSVTSLTASIDMNRSNYFILNLPTSSTTHVAFTNIIPGESINLLVSQSATVATGSIAFAPNIYFPGGNDYVATATGSARDIVSFITFNTAEVYATNVKNLK
jgi:hypothetical protein